MTIRHAIEADWPEIWQLFQAVCLTGEAFAYDTETPESVARKLWFDLPAVPYVVEADGVVVGTYYIRPNQPGRGNHVANAGYIVAEAARGQGLASRLCAHSLEEARKHGFQAMQFNYVVSTNDAAVRTWQQHGFAVVGRVPRAFRHARLGAVDVLVMFRQLDGDSAPLRA